jgi:hypothetical protein
VVVEELKEKGFSLGLGLPGITLRAHLGKLVTQLDHLAASWNAIGPGAPVAIEVALSFCAGSGRCSALTGEPARTANQVEAGKRKRGDTWAVTARPAAMCRKC